MHGKIYYIAFPFNSQIFRASVAHTLEIFLSKDRGNSLSFERLQMSVRAVSVAVMKNVVVNCCSLKFIGKLTFHRLFQDVRIRLINHALITTFRLLYWYSSPRSPDVD